MNTATIIGNLTNDPILKEGQYGTLCFFKVGVSNYNKPSDYFNVRVTDKRAENCAKYLKKGSKVALTGSVHLDAYGEEDKKRYCLSLNATNVEFLLKTEPETSKAVQEAPKAAEKQEGTEYQEVYDEELPF